MNTLTPTEVNLIIIFVIFIAIITALAIWGAIWVKRKANAKLPAAGSVLILDEIGLLKRSAADKHATALASIEEAQEAYAALAALQAKIAGMSFQAPETLTAAVTPKTP